MIDTVIVGAGPYGLSIAAHLQHRGIHSGFLGDRWTAGGHICRRAWSSSPMVFASNISDPKDRLTLERFCAERGIRDPDTGVPIQLETFTEYGLTFKARILPHLIATIKDFIENETPSRK